MRAIMEDQFRPRIEHILRIPTIRLQRALQRIETIVVACGAVEHVHGAVGVVEARRVDDVAVDWCHALVDVAVAGEVEVYAVLVAGGKQVLAF